MGRYSGILLCSDIDGTLTWGTLVAKKPTICGPTPETCAAIRRFQEEGGWFTVSSGRMPSHLSHFDGKFEVNAPVVASGGAVVYDIAGKKLLRSRTMDFDLPAVLREMEPWFSCVLHMDIHRFEEDIHTSPEELCDPAAGVWAPGEYLKTVMMFDTQEHAVAAERALLASPLSTAIHVCRSWGTGLEIMSADASKGRAAQFLKEYLGASRLVCVGDFENDLSMAPVADCFVAVGNALPCVQEAAHTVTVSVEEGAVGRVIDSL